MKLPMKVMKKLESGMTEKEIKETLGVSNKTIRKCKNELDIRKNITRLLQEGDLEEAKREADKLEGIIIDTETMFVLLELANSLKDQERQKEVLDQLRKRPMNYENQRRVYYSVLKLEPQNLEAMNELLRIEKRAGNKDEVARIRHLIEEIGKARSVGEITIEAQEVAETEENNPIQLARNIIYQETDIMKAAKQIEDIIEGLNSDEQALLLAEFFYHSGLKTRAEKTLKAYRKGLDETSKKEIKTINQAIELTKAESTQEFSWNAFWERKLIIEEEIRRPAKRSENSSQEAR